MTLLIAIPAIALAFVLGWLAHRALSLHYKQRWLEAVKALSDKQLESADVAEDSGPQILQFGRPEAVPAKQAHNGTPQKPFQYVAGKWALTEHRADDGRVTFFAVRVGFDPVKLGDTANAGRFAALYRRDRENALDAVKAMNDH